MITPPLTPEQRTVYGTVAVDNGSSAEVYRSARRGPTHAADTAALAAAVLKCAREHGGGPVLKVAS